MRGAEMGYIERPTVDSMWQSGMNMGSIYGPAAGQAAAERASTAPASLTGRYFNDPTAFLSVPALIALGFLAWYAVKKYE